jgi:Tfp pilus assembly protein PilN
MKAVNLLPSEQRGSSKTQSAAVTSAPSGSAFGAWVVIGVLAFAVAATAVYVTTTNTIKDRQAKLASVTAEAAATKAQAQALQSFADFASLASQRIATVKGLAGSRFDWERTLRDLSRALPSDVFIQQMQGSTGTQSAAGAATSSAIQAPSIHMTGCTKSQPSVAQLMSRLRVVRGVTRVSLAKSDKDGAVTAVAPTTTGESPAVPCPKGAPPAFDITVYFERAAVAAGAAPNLGTGQAGATGATTGTTGSPAAPATTAPGATGTAPANGAASVAPTTSSPTQPVSATTPGSAK